ncbi:MAG: nuclear transport factor 2 family protein [Acidobacteriaceae bacterium]|nr:nuclear transport factor 2 family protein [Acidobacteriaceae bacterium]
MRCIAFWLRFAMGLSCLALLSQAQNSDDDQKLRSLIQTYADSIDRADTAVADQIWSNSSEATFIHPLGEEHGRAQIEEDVYRRLMGDTFSERKLVPKDVSVHVYADTAWSEFNWDFFARMRKDGSPFHSQGRETQIYHREKGKWRIVHVHYSGVPDSPSRGS